MHIVIFAWYGYYMSNKSLLEECNKEDNVAVTWAAAAYCLE
jgi:hypothetical protein